MLSQLRPIGLHSRTSRITPAAHMYPTLRTPLRPDDSDPCAPQELRARFVGCAADLTVIATLAAGNDYLPALRGASLQGNLATPSLWSLYLRLRAHPEWAGRCAIS